MTVNSVLVTPIQWTKAKLPQSTIVLQKKHAINRLKKVAERLLWRVNWSPVMLTTEIAIAALHILALKKYADNTGMFLRELIKMRALVSIVHPQRTVRQKLN